MENKLQKVLLIWVIIFSFVINFFSLSLCVHKIHETPVDTQRTEAFWNSYLKNLDDKIRKAWKSPSKSAKNVVVSINIGKGGKAFGCKVLQSSGYADIDAGAINSVYAASPFEPLPRGFDGDHITIDYVFPIKRQPLNIIIRVFKLDGSYKERFLNAYKKEVEAEKKAQTAAYMKKLEAKIKKNWNPPKSDKNTRIVAQFKVYRDGRVSDVKIKQGADNEDANYAALNAINASVPFDPFTSLLKASSVDIEFTFDYNILKNK